jgi:hypothetical protein
MRRLIVIVVLFAAIALPSTAFGCSSDYPTFKEAITKADAVALVRVTDPGDPLLNRPNTIHVVRLLKGSLPGTFVLDDPRTDLCGDTIAFWVEQADSPVVMVAFGMPFYDQTIHPLWAESPHNAPSIFSTASVPEGAATMDDMVAAVGLLVPNTALPSPRRGLEWLGVALLVASAVAMMARRLAVGNASGIPGQ